MAELSVFGCFHKIEITSLAKKARGVQMFRLGQKVIIQGDRFEQNLPIGEYAYILAYDKNPDSAFDFVIRVPKLDKTFYVPEADIEHEEVLIKKASAKAQRDALIDYALRTRNKELFDELVGSKKKEEEEEPKSLSQRDFIREVNRRAWV
jgi:hypothetical protein